MQLSRAVGCTVGVVAVLGAAACGDAIVTPLPVSASSVEVALAASPGALVPTIASPADSAVRNDAA